MDANKYANRFERFMSEKVFVGVVRPGAAGPVRPADLGLGPVPPQAGLDEGAPLSTTSRASSMSGGGGGGNFARAGSTVGGAGARPTSPSGGLSAGDTSDGQGDGGVTSGEDWDVLVV